MSRFRDWNNKEAGIHTWIIRQGFEIDVRGQKGRSDMYSGVEIRKIINEYTNVAKITGSYSERLLKINFSQFCQWFKSKQWPKYQTPQPK